MARPGDAPEYGQQQAVGDDDARAGLLRDGHEAEEHAPDALALGLGGPGGRAQGPLRWSQAA